MLCGETWRARRSHILPVPDSGTAHAASCLPAPADAARRDDVPLLRGRRPRGRARGRDRGRQRRGVARDAAERPEGRHRAQHSRPGGRDLGELPRRLRRSPAGLSGNGARRGAHDVPRQPGSHGRSARRHRQHRRRQFQRQHPRGLDAVPLYGALGGPRRGAAHRGAAHARGARLPRGVAPGARRDRAGGRAGPLRAGLRAVREAARAHVRRHALRAHAARHPALVREDDGPDAEELPRHLVRAEQRAPRDRRRRRPPDGARRGEAAVRRHRAEEAARQAAGAPAPRAPNLIRARHRPPERHAHDCAAHAGSARRRLRSPRGALGRAQQSPFRSLRPRARGQGARYGVRARSAARGGPCLRRAVLHRRRGSEGARARRARHPRPRRPRRGAAGARRGGEAPGAQRRTVSAQQHRRARLGVVRGARALRPRLAGRGSRAYRAGDGRGRQPRRAPLPGPRSRRHRRHAAARVGPADRHARRLRRSGVDIPRGGSSHSSPLLGTEGARAARSAALDPAPRRQHAAERPDADRAERGCQRHGERLRPHPQPAGDRGAQGRGGRGAGARATAHSWERASRPGRLPAGAGCNRRARACRHGFLGAGARRALRARGGAARRQRAAPGAAAGGHGDHSRPGGPERRGAQRQPRLPDTALAPRCALPAGRSEPAHGDARDGARVDAGRGAQLLHPGVPARPRHHRGHRQGDLGGRACGHREVLRRLDRERSAARHRPPAGASQRAGHGDGARSEPGAGSRSAGADAGAHSLRPRLLSPAARQRGARRKLLCHAAQHRSAQELRPRVLGAVAAAGGQDPQCLPRRVRERPPERRKGRRDGRARGHGHAGLAGGRR